MHLRFVTSALSILAAPALLGCTETLRAPLPPGGAPDARAQGRNDYASTPGDPSATAEPDGSPDVGPTAGAWSREGRGRYLELDRPVFAVSSDGTRALTIDGRLVVDDGRATAPSTFTLRQSFALSADGSTVVGATGPSACTSAARWTDQGLVGSTVAGGLTFVSRDGASAAGTTWPAWTCAVPAPRRAFVWTHGDPVLIDALPGQDQSEALALSGDGSTLIALGSNEASGAGELFAQDIATGARTFADAPASPSLLHVEVSDDGTVVAGDLAPRAPFVWTRGDALLPLPAVVPDSSFAGLSADGSTVLLLADGASASVPLAVPVLWSAARGAEVLPLGAPLLGIQSVHMSPDAAFVVGNAVPNDVGPVVLWDRTRTPRLLFDDAPAFTARCHPIVDVLSADGRTFAGNCGSTGGATGFVARF
jgi:hypothetical protein